MILGIVLGCDFWVRLPDAPGIKTDTGQQKHQAKRVRKNTNWTHPHYLHSFPGLYPPHANHNSTHDTGGAAQDGRGGIANIGLGLTLFLFMRQYSSGKPQ